MSKPVNDLVHQFLGGTGNINDLRHKVMHVNSAFVVEDRDSGGPPGSPTEGTNYIVDVASGDWSTFNVNDIARYDNGTWVAEAPDEGMQRLWVKDEDLTIIWDGSAWVVESLSSTGGPYTPGAVTFGHATSGGLAEDDTNLHWDDTNNRLGIGTNTPEKGLSVADGIKQTVEKDPVVLGSVTDATNLNGASGVHVSGDYAYVACEVGDSLTVVDISDPTSPSVAGQVIDATNLNGARSVHVSGNYAYAACLTGDSLTVVDISDPTTPSVAGQVIDATNLNGAFDTYVLGSYAYVSCSTGNSLTVVDISDPTAPSVAGQVIDGTNLSGARGVSVLGSYAYVVCFSADRLTVVDISDPTAPNVVGSVTDAVNLNGSQGVSISGNYAYVACFNGNSLTVVDISDPTAPSVAGQVIDATNLNDARDVYVSGSYAYVSCSIGNSLTVVDISDPTAPSVAGQVIDGTNLNGAIGIYVSGNYAYVGSATGDSLTVVDIHGTTLQAANIGNIKTHHIDVDQEAQVGNLLVKSGANIGGDALVGGSLSVGGIQIRTGTGTPESAVVGTVGDLFIRTDGGASTVLYVKESGTGNTGWVAK